MRITSTRKETFKRLDEVLRVFYKMPKYKASAFAFTGHLTDDFRIGDLIELIQKLIKDGYIIQIVPKEKQGSYADLIYRLNFEGRFFIESGGYSSAYHKQARQKIWTWVKVVAATLNAIAILYISYWSVKTSIEANEDKTANQELSKKLDSVIYINKLSQKDSFKIPKSHM